MPPITILEDALARARRLGSLHEALVGLANLFTLEFPVHRVIVGLLHPDGERLVLVGVWSSGPTQVRLGALVRVEATAFPELLQGEEIVVTDEHASPHELPLLEKILWAEGVRSMVTIPVRDNAIPVGVLILASRLPGGLPAGQRLLFGTLGIVCEKTLVELGLHQMTELLRTESPDQGDNR